MGLTQAQREQVARAKAGFRFFVRSAPAVPVPPPGEPEPIPPAPEPSPLPDPAGAPGAAPSEMEKTAPAEPEPEPSPYMAALRAALAENTSEAWEAFNAESSRLEEEERKACAPPAPAAPARRSPVRETPPAPPRRVPYSSPLAEASRRAYAEAPPEIRRALDGLFSIPGVFKLERNAWSGAVGAWTESGAPSPDGQAYLSRHGELAPWTLGLRARCYMPRDAGARYLAPEELEESRTGRPSVALPSDPGRSSVPGNGAFSRGEG